LPGFSGASWASGAIDSHGSPVTGWSTTGSAATGGTTAGRG
jgi:hypothetical protein